MVELLTSMIEADIVKYEEKLEMLKASKEEIVKDVKKIERLKKLVAKAEVDGVKLEIPVGEDKVAELEQIEKDIKITKSLLRRLGTVCDMYELEIVE